MKAKLGGPAPAEDLYVSPLFRGRRRYVERTCDRWFILSALHGVVQPETVVAPYDETLKHAGRVSRREWSAAVLADLERRLGPLGRHTFEVHAGSDYRDWGLVAGLRKVGATDEVPTEGLGVGRQLAFYTRQP